MRHAHRGNVVFGKVRWSPVKSLQGPCIGLSEQWLQRLAGEPVSVACVPAQARLVLRYDSDKDGVRGLPALLIAIGSRNVWTAGGAVLLLPLAMACEMVRGQFQA